MAPRGDHGTKRAPLHRPDFEGCAEIGAEATTPGVGGDNQGDELGRRGVIFNRIEEVGRREADGYVRVDGNPGFIRIVTCKPRQPSCQLCRVCGMAEFGKHVYQPSGVGGVRRPYVSHPSTKSRDGAVSHERCREDASSGIDLLARFFEVPEADPSAGVDEASLVCGSGPIPSLGRRERSSRDRMTKVRTRRESHCRGRRLQT